MKQTQIYTNKFASQYCYQGFTVVLENIIILGVYGIFYRYT